MIGLFADLDQVFGGGHSRFALASYLANDVAPRLRSRASPALRERMLAAAAQLTYLAGFMCFDDRAHGLAQRYYRTAMELSVENNDPASYAMVLRALSVQARALGHRGEAADLAAVAVSEGRHGPVDRRAFLLGQLAVSQAAVGDRTAALAALTSAVRALDRATSASVTSIGSFHPAALAHQEAAVREHLGDRRGAITALSASLHQRPVTERRSRAVTTALLAEFQLADGRLDQAVGTWTAFLDDYPFLTSGRARTALATLCAGLKPHERNPGVRNLLGRARTIRSGVPPLV
jgi:tetratricopeptide (TPR) repeat protein